MTVESSYTKVDVSDEATPKSPPKNQDAKHLMILLCSVIIICGLCVFAFFYFKPSCEESLPSRIWFQCIAINTSTPEVFRCQAKMGYFVCPTVKPSSSICNPQGYFNHAWSECTYIEGPNPYSNVTLTDVVARCSYLAPACRENAKTLVNMDCCQQKPF